MNQKSVLLGLLVLFVIMFYVLGSTLVIAESGSGRDGNDRDREDDDLDDSDDDSDDDDDSSGKDVFRFKEERTIVDENGVESEVRVEYREREDGRIEQKIKYKSKDGESEIEIEFEDEIEVEDEAGDDKNRSRGNIKVKLRDGTNASIKVMPDVAAARALEVLRLHVCSADNNCTIVLKDVGQRDEVDDSDEIGDDEVNDDDSIEAGDDSNRRLRYEVRAEKRYRMLGLFPRSAEVRVEISADDGGVVDTDRPWWTVFSSEVESETETETVAQ